MNEKSDFALVPTPANALGKAQPSAKRILSDMVVDTLALVPPKEVAPSSVTIRMRLLQAAVLKVSGSGEQLVASPAPKFRIGEYAWREPDYQQILIWAKTLSCAAEEVVRRLQAGRKQRYGGEWEAHGKRQLRVQAGNPVWSETKFAHGAILALNWDFELLPIEKFEWVPGLLLTHLGFASSPKHPPNLRLRVPSLTHLCCNRLGLSKLDLSGVPFLTELSCANNQLSELDLARVPLLTKLSCSNNQLSELALSHLPLLTELSCDDNQLTNLDLSRVPLLKRLVCQNNKLSNIDFSAVPLLTGLACGGNPLNGLDLANVPLLSTLLCRDNRLTKLETSRLPRLTVLHCHDNALRELDIRPINALQRLMYDEQSTRLIQRPDQHF